MCDKDYAPEFGRLRRTIAGRHYSAVLALAHFGVRKLLQSRLRKQALAASSSALSSKFAAMRDVPEPTQACRSTLFERLRLPPSFTFGEGTNKKVFRDETSLHEQ